MLWPNQFQKIRKSRHDIMYRIDLTNPLRSYNAMVCSNVFLCIKNTIISFECVDFWPKNLVFWDPPLKKFHNRTDLDWSATAIFMSRKEPNCFRKSLHDIASASSFYAWKENGNYLFLFLYFSLKYALEKYFT